MKKKLLLLGAGLLSLGTIGGTLALWAVTDKADPFSIGISPGTVSTDTTTDYVTLEWGTSQSISNVSNLKRGEIRKAGVLDLKAGSDAQTNYQGKLELALTAGNASGTSLISNYLNVKVYKGNITDTDGVINPASIDPENNPEVVFTTGASLVTVTNTKSTDETPKHNLYTVAVSLNNEMTISQYDAVADAQVTATFDWNANPATVITQNTLFATGFTGGTGTYVYAFGDHDNQNAPWPGVKMDETNFDGIYQANVSTEFTTVIFNNGNPETGKQQSGDLAIATVFTGTNNRYNYVSDSEDPKHGTIDHFNPEQEKMYYVVGQGLTVGGQAVKWPSAGLVEAAKMTVNEGKTTATLDHVTTTLDAEFKIYEAVTGRYYPDGNNWLVQAGSVGANMKITYTIGGTSGSDIVVTANA